MMFQITPLRRRMIDDMTVRCKRCLTKHAPVASLILRQSSYSYSIFLNQCLLLVASWSSRRGAGVVQVPIDALNWALFDVENWTPADGCPETRMGWLVQVVPTRSLWTHLGKLLVMPIQACSA
jgi:hypothetical protein